MKAWRRALDENGLERMCPWYMEDLVYGRNCGGFTWVGRRVPPRPPSHSLSSKGKGDKIRHKGLKVWDEDNLIKGN